LVFIGDGASWIWELARGNFPTAMQILDLFHALERMHTLCDGLYGVGSAWARRMEDQWEQAFKEDKVLESFPPPGPDSPTWVTNPMGPTRWTNRSPSSKTTTTACCIKPTTNTDSSMAPATSRPAAGLSSAKG